MVRGFEAATSPTPWPPLPKANMLVPSRSLPNRRTEILSPFTELTVKHYERAYCGALKSAEAMKRFGEGGYEKFAFSA
jgi:hypothetical protein